MACMIAMALRMGREARLDDRLAYRRPSEVSERGYPEFLRIASSINKPFEQTSMESALITSS